VQYFLNCISLLHLWNTHWYLNRLETVLKKTNKKTKQDKTPPKSLCFNLTLTHKIYTQDWRETYKHFKYVSRLPYQKTVNFISLLKIEMPKFPLRPTEYYLGIRVSNICNLHNVSNAYLNLRTQTENPPCSITNY